MIGNHGALRESLGLTNAYVRLLVCHLQYTPMRPCFFREIGCPTSYGGAPDGWESARFQAFFYALAFFWLDGFAVPAPTQVTQAVGRIHANGAVNDSFHPSFH